MLNNVTIKGKVSIAPELLYTNRNGINKYQFYVDIERNSGYIDCIPVVTIKNDLQVGQKILIKGKYSSFNLKHDEKKKLKLHVYADEIETLTFDELDMNEVELSGTICKQPIIRKTPLNKYITDMLIAVNRTDNKYSDYIPIILWGSNAYKAANMNIGDKVTIKGRVQSRAYTKDDSERIAYEISAFIIES